MSNVTRKRIAVCLDGSKGTRQELIRVEREPWAFTSNLFFKEYSLGITCQIVPKLPGASGVFVPDGINRELAVDIVNEFHSGNFLLDFNVKLAVQALNDFYERAYRLDFHRLSDVIDPHLIGVLEQHNLLFEEEIENLNNLNAWVYLLRGKKRSNGQTIHKIGFTVDDIRGREVAAKRIMGEWIMDIEKIAHRRGNKNLEQKLHDVCAEYQVPPLTIGRKQEWFAFPNEQIAIFTFLNGWIPSRHLKPEERIEHLPVQTLLFA